jgi:tetratricopeptide (TPR) repeat protein
MPTALRFAAALALGLLLGAGARADDAPSWQAATQVLKATLADFDTNGIRGVKSHVDDLEVELGGAKQAIDTASKGGFVLVDGMTETLIAMAAVTKAPGGRVAAVANPYPMMSLLLGSYYNETGRPDDALRVMDLGLSTFAVSGDMHVGEHWPSLVFERGAALVTLKRWPEVLSGYDDALKAVPDMDAGMKARFQRGRGFALTELGRLDEAEAAYTESLKLDPSSDRARHELAYIAGLRAGAPPQPGGLMKLQPTEAPVTPPTPAPAATPH